MMGTREVALIGAIVLVATVYLLALFVALGSPHSARSATPARDLSEADFVRLAAKRCAATRDALGPGAVRHGGSPASRAALAKEAAATRDENRALAKLVARTRAPGVEHVRLARFVRTQGRVVTTLRLAVRTRDVKQAGELVRVAYGRVTLDGGELGLGPCGLD
jgi:hypothetical protein